MSVVIYGADWCTFCEKAKTLMFPEPFEFRDIDEDESAVDLMLKEGFNTVPQVFIDGKHIGGYEDLKTFVQGD